MDVSFQVKNNRNVFVHSSACLDLVKAAFQKQTLHLHQKLLSIPSPLLSRVSVQMKLPHMVFDTFSGEPWERPKQYGEFLAIIGHCEIADSVETK